jgi:hypothetical protein
VVIKKHATNTLKIRTRIFVFSLKDELEAGFCFNQGEHSLHVSEKMAEKWLSGLKGDCKHL